MYQKYCNSNFKCLNSIRRRPRHFMASGLLKHQRLQMLQSTRHPWYFEVQTKCSKLPLKTELKLRQTSKRKEKMLSRQRIVTSKALGAPQEESLSSQRSDKRKEKSISNTNYVWCVSWLSLSGIMLPSIFLTAFSLHKFWGLCLFWSSSWKVLPCCCSCMLFFCYITGLIL